MLYQIVKVDEEGNAKQVRHYNFPIKPNIGDLILLNLKIGPHEFEKLHKLTEGVVIHQEGAYIYVKGLPDQCEILDQ